MTATRPMVDLRDVMNAFRSEGSPPGAGRFAIRRELHGSYLAREGTTQENQLGNASLLLPVTSLAGGVGRVAGATSLVFQEVSFEIDRLSWNAPCAVICCLDDGLVHAFSALAVDLALRLTDGGRKPNAREVSRALAEWEKLFRGLKRPSEERELGLWGELTLIMAAPDPDAALRAWRGPYGAHVDFFSGSIGLECKCSKSRFRHQISLNQTERPPTAGCEYVVSFWASPDRTFGKSVSDLVAELERQTSDPLLLERGLLAAGFSRNEGLWCTPYALLDEPGWFRLEDVPRVHEVDPGVSDVRYMVELDEDLKLTPDAITAAWAGFNRERFPNDSR